MPSPSESLDARLRAILPEGYQDSYEALRPSPMGSADLKFDAGGRVAWDEVWGSFCDLAMAGGPPHKGALLEPGRLAAIDADRARYDEVVEEICRGITLATDLPARPSPTAGWVRVHCHGETMAAWLLRAITMENVAVRAEGRVLDLPAAPHFRLDKEIKNVVTVIAKTSHYWIGHMPRAQKHTIAILFDSMAREWPLLQPDTAIESDRSDPFQKTIARMAETIHRETGLDATSHRYHGWLGVDATTVPTALWLARALVATNVLSRREETTCFLPVSATDQDSATGRFAHLWRLALNERAEGKRRASV